MPRSKKTAAFRRIIAGVFLVASVLEGAPAAVDDPDPRDTARTVGYLAASSRRTGEDSAAIRWLSSDPGFTARTLDMDRGLPDLTGIDVLWIHIPDSAEYERWKPRLGKLKSLKVWYDSGGRFLFTGLAAMIPYAVGIETAKPSIEAMDVEDDWLFDQKGFQGYRLDVPLAGLRHPVFAGLFGGTFTWDADSNHRLWCAGYFGGEEPATGKVIAVEKSYITISADRRLVIEYDNPKGMGIAAGGFIFFAQKNHRRQAMEKFVENVLDHLTTGDARYSGQGGQNGDRIPRPFEHFSGKSLPTSFGLLIRRDTATRNFFDLAAPSILLMGKENAGIDEIWVHPSRLIRDYRVGIVRGDTVVWLNTLSPAIEVRPETFRRIYATPFGTLKELLCVSNTEPAAIARYEFDGPESIGLLVSFRSDLRLMWPYDSPATNPLRYGYDTASGTVFITTERQEEGGVAGADAVPLHHLTGAYDSVWWAGGSLAGRRSEANEVMHAALYEMQPRTPWGLTVGICGRSAGYGMVALARVLAAPDAVIAGQVSRYRDLFDRMTTIKTPDTEFNDLFKWALVGTDRFRVSIPEIGTGLLAGFSTTEHGWDGAQKVSGRPGYAWYFGRDAAWSGFAISDYGDLHTVIAELDLMGKYQDISGKIFHEISTSGSVHYDAADATPLYVVLAAHLYRAWGESSDVRKRWPSIQRAMEYLYSTDTDGDLLIENTDQGHGWVEGGKLYPVHTEFYLAGAWCRALLDAAYMAEHLGMRELAGKYKADGERVKAILNRDFWNPGTKFFNFGKMADGTYKTEPTVLPATVMHFGLLDDDKVRPVLEQYAGSGFTSDWGVRIVTSSSPLFNPQGYHYGSVWPLFTGWTALAEYEYGNSTQGFTHILNNMYIKNHWALGFVEEVMNGALYQPSGVCPHQCWSETGILHPAITGMIGWKPDAPAHRADLSPRFPVHWDSITVQRLRVGMESFHFEMVREVNRTVWTFMGMRYDTTFMLRFSPEIPDGMTIRSITVDGREVPVPAGGRRGLLDPPIEIAPGLPGTKVVIEHSGGIGVVPAMPRPEPGDSSTGHRIVSEEMRDGVYEIKVEGRQGSAAEIEVRTFDRGIGSVENAAIVGEVKNGIYRLMVEFPEAVTPYVAVTVKVRVE